MGCGNLGLIHVRQEVRIVADCDTCEEYLIYCCEDIQKSDSVVTHEDSSDIKDYTKHYKSHNL